MTPKEEQQDRLVQRQQAYRQFFESEPGKLVLRDLARFCRAHKSTFHPDARVAASMDGRREVWLRIQEHMQLDSDELWLLYTQGIK